MRFLLIFFCVLFNTLSFSQYNDTIVLTQNMKGAAKGRWICVWGDTKMMEMELNGLIYQFRSGLRDGIYVAFTDDKYKDTAMVAVIEGGELNGLVSRWYNGQIEEECEYRNGLQDGWRKLYLYDKEYGRMINIQKCSQGVCTEIYTEF